LSQQQQHPHVEDLTFLSFTAVARSMGISGTSMSAWGLSKPCSTSLQQQQQHRTPQVFERARATSNATGNIEVICLGAQHALLNKPAAAAAAAAASNATGV
jgi:hypothetical protein